MPNHRYPLRLESIPAALKDARRSLQACGLSDCTISNGRYVIGEAVANCILHSGGTYAWVGVRKLADGAAILVKDDGHGADLPRILSDELSGRLQPDLEHGKLHRGLSICENMSDVLRLRRRSVFAIVRDK